MRLLVRPKAAVRSAAGRRPVFRVGRFRWIHGDKRHQVSLVKLQKRVFRLRQFKAERGIMGNRLMTYSKSAQKDMAFQAKYTKGEAGGAKRSLRENRIRNKRSF